MKKAVFVGAVVSLLLPLFVFLHLGSRELGKKIRTEKDWSEAYASIVALFGDEEGKLALSEGYVDDAYEWASDNREQTWAKELLSFNPEDVFEEKGAQEAAILCYQARWAGPEPTLERILRIHVGGPIDRDRQQQWLDESDKALGAFWLHPTKW